MPVHQRFHGGHNTAPSSNANQRRSQLTTRRWLQPATSTQKSAMLQAHATVEKLVTMSHQSQGSGRKQTVNKPSRCSAFEHLPHF